MKKRIISLTLAAVLCVSFLCGTVSASESTSANEKEIYSFLTGVMDLNTAAACGIMSNIYYETGFRADITAGTYYGLFMYYQPLGDALKSWCSQNGYAYSTVEGQMRYFKAMCDGKAGNWNYVNLYSELLKISNTAEGAYEAGDLFCRRFEKPSNVDAAAQRRGTYAKETLFPKYKDSAPSTEQKEEKQRSTYSYTETDVSYTGTVTGSTLNVRSGPGTGYQILKVLKKGETVSVVAEAPSESGSTWCKLSGGGWVSSNYLRKSTGEEKKEEPKPEETKPAESLGTSSSSNTEYTVTASALNVRSGAGTGFSVLRCVYKGNKVYVTEEQKDSEGTVWCRLSSGGWVSKAYLRAEEQKTQASGGYTVNASGLNVRSGAGTGYAVVKCLSRGTFVTVSETAKDSSGRAWGKISSGCWVCMEYLKTNG